MTSNFSDTQNTTLNADFKSSGGFQGTKNSCKEIYYYLTELVHMWVRYSKLSYKDAWHQIYVLTNAGSLDEMTEKQVLWAQNFVQERLDHATRLKVLPDTACVEAARSKFRSARGRYLLAGGREQKTSRLLVNFMNHLDQILFLTQEAETLLVEINLFATDYMNMKIGLLRDDERN